MIGRVSESEGKAQWGCGLTEVVTDSEKTHKTQADVSFHTLAVSHAEILKLQYKDL